MFDIKKYSSTSNYPIAPPHPSSNHTTSPAQVDLNMIWHDPCLHHHSCHTCYGSPDTDARSIHAWIWQLHLCITCTTAVKVTASLYWNKQKLETINCLYLIAPDKLYSSLKIMLESLKGTYMNDQVAFVEEKTATHEIIQHFTHFSTDDTPDYSNLIFEMKSTTRTTATTPALLNTWTQATRESRKTAPLTL